MASVFKTKHLHPLFTHRNLVQYLLKQSKKCVIKGQKCQKSTSVLTREEQTHTHTVCTGHFNYLSPVHHATRDQCIFTVSNRCFTFCREALWAVSSFCISLLDRTGHGSHLSARQYQLTGCKVTPSKHSIFNSILEVLIGFRRSACTK